MLAIDAAPAKGKLQVLDFLVPGDVVSASTVLPTPGISLRAITSASLVLLDPPAADRLPAHDYWRFLIAQCLNQLARVNIHQLMIGRLETEPRVASFILGLALRNVREGTREITVELPMSRIDIANYLVINCDTLSRIMMRFCDCGLIERESRHAIRVIDLDALRKKSPLASLLSAVFEKETYRQGSALDPAPKETLSRASVHANHGAIPPLVTAGPLPIPVQSTLMPRCLTGLVVGESERKMCGIVGVVGQGPAAAPILDALRRLEYRGYDSAGIATLERGLLTRRRAVGKLRNLESKLTASRSPAL